VRKNPTSFTSEVGTYGGSCLNYHQVGEIDAEWYDNKAQLGCVAPYACVSDTTLLGATQYKSGYRICGVPKIFLFKKEGQPFWDFVSGAAFYAELSEKEAVSAMVKKSERIQTNIDNQLKLEKTNHSFIVTTNLTPMTDMYEFHYFVQCTETSPFTKVAKNNTDYRMRRQGFECDYSKSKVGQYTMNIKFAFNDIKLNKVKPEDIGFTLSIPIEIIENR